MCATEEIVYLYLSSQIITLKNQIKILIENNSQEDIEFQHAMPTLYI